MERCSVIESHETKPDAKAEMTMFANPFDQSHHGHTDSLEWPIEPHDRREFDNPDGEGLFRSIRSK